MGTKRGKVVERKLFIEVEGKKHYMPKGCDPIIGPQLEAFAGKEVEVLIAKDTVLAIRALEPEEVKPFKPIIICYLCPPEIVFDPGIMRKVEPLITESLVASNYLDNNVVEQLNKWKDQYGRQ